jgi:hypothetical protein
MLRLAEALLAQRRQPIQLQLLVASAAAQQKLQGMRSADVDAMIQAGVIQLAGVKGSANAQRLLHLLQA